MARIKCQECDRTFGNKHGLAVHTYRMHGRKKRGSVAVVAHKRRSAVVAVVESDKELSQVELDRNAYLAYIRELTK